MPASREGAIEIRASLDNEIPVEEKEVSESKADMNAIIDYPGEVSLYGGIVPYH